MVFAVDLRDVFLEVVGVQQRQLLVHKQRAFIVAQDAVVGQFKFVVVLAHQVLHDLKHLPNVLALLAACVGDLELGQRIYFLLVHAFAQR